MLLREEGLPGGLSSRLVRLLRILNDQTNNDTPALSSIAQVTQSESLCVPLDSVKLH